DSSDASDADDDADDDVEDDDTDDDADDEFDDDADDDTQTECDVWTDTTSGLTWLVEPLPFQSGWAPWPDAVDACEILDCGGHDDWRLPTISELRSLIRGCESTQLGGECDVTDDCLDVECAEFGEAYNCTGCGSGMGPNEGCYWPDELEGECTMYWSSSTPPPPTMHETAWKVSFRRAGIGDSGYDLEGVKARCARGEFAPVEVK
ncbi:MAG: DUF1566 domain-containing protein, partial [Deltaproteobacteria bacterium]|nr:DUF1566 domain-containing protein [Deltaproteobacteria bacterium]